MILHFPHNHHHSTPGTGQQTFSAQITLGNPVHPFQIWDQTFFFSFYLVACVLRSTSNSNKYRACHSLSAVVPPLQNFSKSRVLPSSTFLLDFYLRVLCVHTDLQCHGLLWALAGLLHNAKYRNNLNALSTYKDAEIHQCKNKCSNKSSVLRILHEFNIDMTMS